MTLPEALAVRGLGVALGGRRVLQGVTFTLASGAFCGLIGANGSGKTTLLRAILGHQKASEGRVHVAGAGRRIGYVPQKVALDPLTPIRAADLVALGLDGHRFGPPWPSRDRARRVEQMLHAVGAEDFAGQRLGTLSGGQQQRVLIGHALIREPKLLLLDEPLASLDPGSAGAIVALLRQLSRAFGTAILLSAHDMNPLLPAIDRLVYLAHGRAASGTAEEVVRGDVLGRLYGHPIDVLRVRGRIVVVAAETEADAQVPASAPQHVALLP